MARLDELTSWHSDWQNLRVGVIGLGVTGFSVADTLAELGAKPFVVAQSAQPDLLDILDVIGVPYLVGEAASQTATEVTDGVPAQLKEFAPEVIVTSPGIRPDSAIILWANQQNIPVWVDLDLAWRLRDKTAKTAEWICITGTNGKTTTTQLVEAMLVEANLRAIAVGNIGVPILDAIRDPQGFDYLVVELSSFQLHYLGQISPIASAILNIDYDHLDWHGGYQNYAKTKGKVYANTQIAAVFNDADKATIKLLEDADVIEGCRAVGFRLGSPGTADVGYVEDILVDRAFVESYDEALPVCDFADIGEIGVVTPHLLANVAAAAALALAVGVERSSIRAAIRSFKLDHHRIEMVAEANGVQWFDDSKATNPHATAASLASFDKVVWVVGGLLKGVDVAPLVKRYAHKLRAAIVIGVERQSILAALEAHAPGLPVIEITTTDNSDVMNQVVENALKVAQPGDTVLLAPAAASMDQFKDYADRGHQFAEAARFALAKNLGEN